MTVAVTSAHEMYELDTRALEPRTHMPTSIPPEIFRRRATLKLVEKVVRALDNLEDVLALEYELPARAVRYAIAAQMLERVHRPDLATEMTEQKTAAVERARKAFEDRRREPRIPRDDDGNGGGK